jgi:hypothetical protein
VSSGIPAGNAGSHVVIAELEVKPERLGAFPDMVNGERSLRQGWHEQEGP